MLHFEGPDIARRSRKPDKAFQCHHGRKQISQVVVVGQIDASLNADKTEAGQGAANISVGLRDALRMICGSVGNMQVERYSSNYRSFGSSNMSVNL